MPDEKLAASINHRLDKVEEHMTKGEENRQFLMLGFSSLKKSVDKMESTLFGEKGQEGLVTQINAVLKIAEAIRTVLTKIFVSICSAIAFAVLPQLLKYLSQMLAHNTGG